MEPKQDIFEEIVKEMDSRYEKRMSIMQMDGREAENDRELYANINEDSLVSLGEKLFLYFRDEYASKVRKILTLEQYSNKELADMFIRRYYDDPLDYQEASFKMLSEAERLAPEDARIMALHFYAPIFLLHILCDANPDMEHEALKLTERHIRQFIRIYGNPDTKKMKEND